MSLDSEEIRKRQQRRAEMRARQRAEQRKVYFGLAAAAVVLIAVAVVIFMASRGGTGIQDPPPTEAQVQTQPPTQPATQTGAVTAEEPMMEPTTVIRVAAIGDLIATDKVVASGVTGGGYDYTEMLMDVAPLLADADLTVMNFEGILDGEPYGGEKQSAPIELMQALRRAGVDAVQLANSCSINNGLRGLSATINSVKTAGMESVGTFQTAEAFQKSKGFTMMEVGGMRVALVAFTKGMDGMGLPAGSEDCVNLLYTDYESSYQTVDKAGIQDILENIADEEPDVTIALLHWGSEFNDQLSDSQETIRSLMLSGGVDVIIGTHSHYVQRIDHDPEAGTLVAYSLGDFVGKGERAGTSYSVVLNLEITRDNTTGETKVTDYSYTPIYTISDETKVRIVRIREAMVGFEAGYIQRVSQEDYDSMAYALERIEARIHPEEE